MGSRACKIKTAFQSYDPRKLTFHLTPSWPIPFGASSVGVSFLDVYGLKLFLHHKNFFETHCNIAQKACSHHISSKR